MIYFKKYFFVFIVFLIISGCNTERACNEYNTERQNYIVIKFYSLYKTYGITKTVDSTLSQIAILDTILKNNQSLKLPLSQSYDTTQYELQINDHPKSIFTIIYKRNRVFINYDCGFRTDYEIDTVYFEPNPFDSIQIIQPHVTDPYEENIKLYFNRPVVSTHS